MSSSHPQADRLDGAARLAEVDRVADAVLVLEDHEDAGQEVLHQALGTETEGHPDDAGARDQRPDRVAQLGDRGDAEHGEDHDRGDALEQRPHRLRPLHPPAGEDRRWVRLLLVTSAEHRARQSLRRPAYEPVDHAVQEPAETHSEQQQHEQCQRLRDEPRRQLLAPVLAEAVAQQVAPLLDGGQPDGGGRTCIDDGQGEKHGGDVTRRAG
jgi:hypothetical protein